MRNALDQKLGKREPKLDKRTFKLSKYLLDLAPPPAENWIQPSVSIPMYGNDYLGDCVPAAAGHMQNLWRSFSAPQAQELSVRDIIQAYSAAGGYFPGQPSTDNGMYMLDMLKYWRKVGLGGRKILAFVSLTPGDLVELEQATWLFGSVMLGLQLPASAQGKNEWSVPDRTIGAGAPGSWGGHCVPVARYDQSIPARYRNRVITWGSTMPMSDYFFQVYCDEAYAVLSQDWITAKGLSPSLFDLEALQADLAAL